MWEHLTVANHIQGVFIVSTRLTCLVLHELCRSYIDQNLGSLSHLKVLILEPHLDGQQSFLVKLNGEGQIVMFSHSVAKLV